jgi:hypothetical protein
VLTDPASMGPVARRMELLESACRDMPDTGRIGP